MKFPRLITRRRVKWVGTVLYVLVLGVYVASVWCWAEYAINRPKREMYIDISRGRLGYHVLEFSTSQGHLLHARNEFRAGALNNPSIDLRHLWLTRVASNIATDGGPWSTTHEAYLPLWFPLLLIAAPTAWLWYTDRRAKPWQCPKCRYDLRGLDGGVCPECGHELKPSNAEGVAD